MKYEEVTEAEKSSGVGSSNLPMDEEGGPTRRESKQKSIFCIVCGVGYPNFNCLNAHMRKHKCHKCAHCEATIEPYGKYLYHLATKHAPKFKCNLCEAVMKSPNKMLAHILEHEQMAKVAEKVYQNFRRVE